MESYQKIRKPRRPNNIYTLSSREHKLTLNINNEKYIETGKEPDIFKIKKNKLRVKQNTNTCKIYNKYKYLIKYNNGLPDLVVDMWEAQVTGMMKSDCKSPNISSIVAISLSDN